MDRIRNLSRAQILVIVAAIAIISVFILPWWWAGEGESGWNMVGDFGLGSTSIILIPLAALAIAGLVFLYKTTEEQQWLYCLIASAVTLIPILWYFFWKQRDIYKFLDYGLGYWINLLAAIVMVGLSAYTYYQKRQAKGG